MTDRWSVTVRLNGEDIVTIESNHLAGRDIGLDEEEEAIRTAARHLLAFIGQEHESCQAECPICAMLVQPNGRGWSDGASPAAPVG